MHHNAKFNPRENEPGDSGDLPVRLFHCRDGESRGGGLARLQGTVSFRLGRTRWRNKVHPYGRCWGGVRNNTAINGVPFAKVQELVGALPRTETAVYQSADGYHRNLRLTELDRADASLAFEVNEERIDTHGHRVRLAVPRDLRV